MEKYKTIKQIGRKYLAPAIVAGALVFGGNAYSKESSLPVYSETRTEIINLQKEEESKRNQELESLASSYNSHIESARTLFNKGISDGKLTRAEQEGIYSEYKNAIENAENLRKLSKEYKIQKYSEIEDLSSNDYLLHRLIDKNLNGADKWNTSLEKKLKSDGLNIEVEAKNTVVDVLACFIESSLMGLGALASIVGIGTAYEKIKKRRQEKSWRE